MASKYRPIQFRNPKLRQALGGNADRIAKAIFLHPSVQQAIEEGVCPECKLPFSECNYFRSLDDD